MHKLHALGCGSTMGAIVAGGLSGVGNGVSMGSIVAGGLSEISEIGGLTDHVDPSIWLSVELGLHCPLVCRHCIYDAEAGPGAGKPNQDVTAAIIRGVGDIKGLVGITIAGKEPTAYPRELAGLVRGLRSAEVPIALATNGLKTRTVLDADVDCVYVSLDGDRSSHDWCRGAGTFDAAFKTVRALSVQGKTVCVVSSVMAADLTDGRRQIDGVIALAHFLSSEFGGGVSLSISLYYGRPGDPMILGEGELRRLVDGLLGLRMTVRILWTALYSALAEAVVGNQEVTFDQNTGVPVVADTNLLHLVFHRACAPLVALRVGHDGLVYVGCNHLTYPEGVRPYLAVGNVLSEPVPVIAERFLAGESWLGGLDGPGPDALTSFYEQRARLKIAP